MVMKIKEVSQKTGLSKKTIRFYEEEGLIDPEKTYQNGRAYRTYTQAHIQTLNDVALLRRARFSVEEIKTILSTPEEIPALFESYRQRLRTEKDALVQVLAVVDEIAAEELTSKEALMEQITPSAQELTLPATDVHPHFRYLDVLEANLMKRKKNVNLTEDEVRQRKMAANNAAMYAGFSVQNSASNNMAAGGKGGGLDIGNAQKIAAYNLLMNDRD